MKNLELQSLGLMELDAEEKNKIDGGFWQIGAFLTAVAWSAWENIGDIRDGWNDGAKGKPRY